MTIRSESDEFGPKAVVFDRWTPDDLQTEFSRPARHDGSVVTRAWTVWHVAEHDVHHTGEMSLILGMHGAPGLDL